MAGTEVGQKTVLKKKKKKERKKTVILEPLSMVRFWEIRADRIILRSQMFGL